MRIRAFVLVVAVGLLLAGPASADLLFDHFPIDGTNGLSPSISFGYMVSDSFTISGPVTLDRMTFAVWLAPNDVFSSVSWSIGTTAFANDLGFGTASVTHSYQYTNLYDYDINLATFSFGTLDPLSGGTYYITLSDTVNRLPNGGDDPVYWDRNDRPEVSAFTAFGTDVSEYGAESFQILGATPGSGDGNAGTVPEPGTFLLLGSGLLVTSRLLRKMR